MKTRIVVGAALAALLICMLVFGGYVLLIGLLLFSLCGVYEVAQAIRNKGFHPVTIPAFAFALLFGPVYFFGDVVSVAALYWLTVIVSVVWLILSGKNTFADAIVTAFLMFYPTLPLVCMTMVYFHFDRPVALTAACLAFAAPSCADMFAYFGGTLFGKRKLCPQISPKKTVAGAYAAVIGGLVFGALLIPLQRLWSGPVPAWVLLVLGLLLGIVAQAGDLLASMIKRWAEVKDFSGVLPGHGGIMDRIDSILMCSPLVLICFIFLEQFGIY